MACLLRNKRLKAGFSLSLTILGDVESHIAKCWKGAARASIKPRPQPSIRGGNKSLGEAIMTCCVRRLRGWALPPYFARTRHCPCLYPPLLSSASIVYWVLAGSSAPHFQEVVAVAFHSMLQKSPMSTPNFRKCCNRHIASELSIKGTWHICWRKDVWY